MYIRKLLQAPVNLSNCVFIWLVGQFICKILVFNIPLMVSSLLAKVKLRGSAYIFRGGTVDSRYLEVQRTLQYTSKYPYLDTSDVQNWVKKK